MCRRAAGALRVCVRDSSVGRLGFGVVSFPLAVVCGEWAGVFWLFWITVVLLFCVLFLSLVPASGISCVNVSDVPLYQILF